MRFRAAWLLTACLVVTTGPARASEAAAEGEAKPIPAEGPAADAAEEMQTLFHEIFEVTSDTGIPAAQKQDSVAQLVSSRLDYATLARSALGPLAERFSREEYGDFASEYSRYVTSLLVARFARHPDRAVEVDSASYDAERGLVAISGRGAAMVAGTPGVRRLMPRERIPIELLLGQRHGEWRVGAVKLNRVDVSRNFRDQFQSVLERESPADLIAELRKRNREREAQNPFAAKGA